MSTIKQYAQFIAEQQRSQKFTSQLVSEAAGENKAVTKKVHKDTESIEGDHTHLATHGTQHVYASGHSDDEYHMYHVHDTSTGKTHTVELEHGGEPLSHKQIRKEAPKEVSDAAVKTIHKDHKEELS